MLLGLQQSPRGQQSLHFDTALAGGSFAGRIKASLLLPCETLLVLSGSFSCHWRRDQAGEENNQLMGQEVLLWRWAFPSQTGWEPESRGRSSWKMGASIVKAAWVSGRWCLHLLAPMIPIPSGITAGLYRVRSNVPAEQALPQPCLCVYLHSSAAVVWLLVTLLCSQCSPCALCHAGLSHAASADQMLPLLPQILAIPAYFMQPLFLPATPAQDWRWN